MACWWVTNLVPDHVAGLCESWARCEDNYAPSPPHQVGKWEVAFWPSVRDSERCQRASSCEVYLTPSQRPPPVVSPQRHNATHLSYYCTNETTKHAVKKTKMMMMKNLLLRCNFANSSSVVCVNNLLQHFVFIMLRTVKAKMHFAHTALAVLHVLQMFNSLLLLLLLHLYHYFRFTWHYLRYYYHC